MLLIKMALEMVRILGLLAANVTFFEWQVFMDVFSVSNELALSLADKATILAAESLAVTMCDFMPLQIRFEIKAQRTMLTIETRFTPGVLVFDVIVKT